MLQLSTCARFACETSFVRITIGNGWFSGTVWPSGEYSIDPRQPPSRADAIGRGGRFAFACWLLYRRGRRLRAADQGEQSTIAADVRAARPEADAEGIPVLLRIFKEESELEVWKQDTSGRFELLKVYPICRWSGDLGPKVNEGDRQAPEGFYTITPGLMNPNSNYYLAINTGFPNLYDRANDRHGGFLMIHGDCSSRGCYAMTDEQIGEIYSLARESFLGGQPSFQIQAYPFRMTPANLARHRTSPHIAFWKMLKIGNDHFEATHLEPKVDVCDRHYVFDAVQPRGGQIVFNATGRCPAFVVNPEVAGPALEKSHADEVQYAALVRANASVAPVHSGLDGGMNRVFLAQVGGHIPPARVPPPDMKGLPPQPPPVAVRTTTGSAWRARFSAASSVARAIRRRSAGGRRCRADCDRHDVKAEAARRAHRRGGRQAESRPAQERHQTEPQAQPQPTTAAAPAPPREPMPQQRRRAVRSRQPAGNFDSRWGGLQ